MLLPEPCLNTAQKHLPRVWLLPDSPLSRTPGQEHRKTPLQLAYLCRNDALDVRPDVLHNIVDPYIFMKLTVWPKDCR